MSQPIKYWIARDGGITANKVDAINDTSDNSALVAYSDYAALAAENERLKAENEKLMVALVDKTMQDYRDYLATKKGGAK